MDGRNEVTTPETILARFAAAYAEHGAGPERRLVISTHDDSYTGYILRKLDGYPQFEFAAMPWRGGHRPCIHPDDVIRIDYSNARYRGTTPLWQREE